MRQMKRTISIVAALLLPVAAMAQAIDGGGGFLYIDGVPQGGGSSTNTVDSVARALATEALATATWTSNSWVGSAAYDITAGDTNNWSIAYGWGDHSTNGYVYKVGTPLSNQVGVWTGDGTLEGDAGLTYDGAGNLTATSFTGDGSDLSNLSVTSTPYWVGMDVATYTGTNVTLLPLKQQVELTLSNAVTINASTSMVRAPHMLTVYGTNAVTMGSQFRQVGAWTQTGTNHLSIFPEGQSTNWYYGVTTE